MSLATKDQTTVSAPQSQIEVHGDGSALHQFLEIHPPDKASKTPPILSFKRKREVEIPWADIVNKAVKPGAPSVAAIRGYFENSWSFKVKDEAWWKNNNNLLATAPTGGPYVAELGPGKPPVFRMVNGVLAQFIGAGFIIRHGTSGRVYLLISSGEPLVAADFQSFAAYNNAWENKIDGVELVFKSADEANQGHMVFEEIDLRPALIQRRYQELNILKSLASQVKTAVVDAAGKMIPKIIETTFDPDKIEELQRKVLRLNISEFDVQRQIERLASDAARLGYVLPLQKQDVKYKDGTVKPLDAGNLYVAYKRTARWTDYASAQVAVRVGWWIFEHTEMRTVSIPCPKEEVVEDYRLVDTSKDILAEKCNEMIKAGMQVYVFEQTPSGLRTAEGLLLRQIMERCTIDEPFRRSIAVLLPVYEESLTGERLVAKYAVYKRPLPGMVPTAMPRLSLEESLTYRTAWVETQLGELLNTINLAPDEERKITITKRFEQETTVTRTTTSIFDITRAESTDLASEMENQTRQERESSSNLQFSAKASASYGPFSAEASASGGTNSSLKDMSQAISKVASKAARSVNSQNKEEVSTTSTSRTTIAHTDETVATIHNINQGRSLNLMFYRLYNKYKGGLYLESLRFDVISSVEVIAGSEVYESRSYSLEELSSMIKQFSPSQLPFAIKDENAYTERLLNRIETLVTTEYAKPSESPAPAPPAARNRAKPRAQVASLSVERVTFPPPEALARGDTAVDPDAKMTDLSKRLRQLIIDSDTAIAPQELLVAASGLYLDAVVGTQPSTEPYSEQMRDQEVRMRAAEVALKESESAYQQAKAIRLSLIPPTDGANCLTGALLSADKTRLTLSLMLPLALGDWSLQVDGKDNGTFDSADLGRRIVVFALNLKPAPTPPLCPENVLARIKLANKNGDTIAYPTQSHQFGKS